MSLYDNSRPVDYCLLDWIIYNIYHGYTDRDLNSAGIELPSTGGPGESNFYLLGAALIALAGAGLTMKRRRANN